MRCKSLWFVDVIEKSINAVKPARNCYDILNADECSSGVYTVYLGKTQRPVEVYCDMTTDGGGWTVCMTEVCTWYADKGHKRHSYIVVFVVCTRATNVCVDLLPLFLLNVLPISHKNFCCVRSACLISFSLAYFIFLVFDLPLVWDPGVVPCIICFSKLSDFFLMICPR